MTNNNLPMTLVEYFWKASQQIVMLTPNKAPNPDIEGWGSGFLLLYKGHRFLVTCDHNVHMEDDYSEGERKGIDYGVGIICNYSDPDNPLSMGLITVSGFIFYDTFDIDMPELTELKDVTFAELKNDFMLPILTNRLCGYDGSIWVHEGEPKLFINADHTADLDISKEYVITGCIRNKISGIVMNRTTTFRERITYAGTQRFGLSVLENPSNVILSDWKGLSGSPVFNEDGNLVGMLNEVVAGKQSLYVTPIKSILKLIDYYLAVDECSTNSDK